MWALAAAALGALANGISTYRANKINQRNYEEVRKYNTPSAQMARFRSAGLNPHLIYTQQNEAEQRPEWKSPQFDFSSLSNVGSELSQYQNIRESKARVNNLQQVNRQLEQQIIAQMIANKYADLKERLTISQIQETVSSLHEATRKITYELDNILPLEKLKYDLSKDQFEWSKVNDYVGYVFKSKDIDLALSRLGLDWYKTKIETAWQKKLAELISNLPDLSNLSIPTFEEVIKNSFLGTIYDFFNSETSDTSSDRSSGGSSRQIN